MAWRAHRFQIEGYHWVMRDLLRFVGLIACVETVGCGDMLLVAVWMADGRLGEDSGLPTREVGVGCTAPGLFIHSVSRLNCSWGLVEQVISL